MISRMRQLRPTTVPKYTNGDVIKSTSWGGTTDTGTVQDIKWIFHNRMMEWTWGYRIKWDNGGPGFAMEYIPQSYLSPVESTRIN